MEDKTNGFNTVVEFDPTVEALQQMVEATKNITATDLTDKDQLKIVKENRMALKNARVKIEKRGKELRDDAIKYQKDVIAKERELVSIISGEEDRLSEIEEEAKQIQIRKERAEQLPARRERLAVIGDGIEATDDELLALDDTKFDTYVNNRASAKIIADRNKIEADRIANEHEATRLENEKNAREREEKARVDERTRLETQAKEKEEKRIENEKHAAEEKARKEQEERERIEKQDAYRNFRVQLGWSEETRHFYKEENVGGVITVWKKLGVFDTNK